MLIHPLEIDRTALWNGVFIAIIAINALVALLRLWSFHRLIKEDMLGKLFDRFFNLFRRKSREEKWDKAPDEENNGEDR